MPELAGDVSFCCPVEADRGHDVCCLVLRVHKHSSERAIFDQMPDGCRSLRHREDSADRWLESTFLQEFQESDVGCSHSLWCEESEVEPADRCSLPDDVCNVDIGLASSGITGNDHGAAEGEQPSASPVSFPLTPSTTTSTPFPSVIRRTPSFRLSLERSMMCSYPAPRARSAFSVLLAVEIANEAPGRRATCTVSIPTAPPIASASTVCPGLNFANSVSAR
jgi:hypothetical protein